MVSGRLPRPTKLKILAGEPNKDRINENEPEAPPGRPPMPERFNDSKGGKVAWENLLDALEALGILSPVYAHALEVYTDTYIQYRSAVDAVNKYGAVLPNGDSFKRNPYVTEMHMNKASLIKLQAEFGLTPSSLSRISVPGAEKALDALDELMRA